MQFRRLIEKQSHLKFVIYEELTVYAVVRIEEIALNDDLFPIAIQITDLMIADGSRVKIFFFFSFARGRGLNNHLPRNSHP